MRSLQIISINHNSHSTQDRLAMDMSEDLWAELFAYMKYTLQVEGLVHLSTCNRIEIYYEADTDFRFQIIDKWMFLNELGNGAYSSNIKTYLGTDICIRYLLNLSMGFYSAIPGDDQIIAQLKKAFQFAHSIGNLSTLLERSFQAVMKCHKQICNDTDYRKQSVSLAYHSLKSIYNYISKDDLQTKKVLIIGAGDMAAQVVKYINRFSFMQIAICNRTRDKAEVLVTGHPIEVVDYATVDTSEFDIVISCINQGFDKINAASDLEYYIDLSLRSATIGEVEFPHILLPELQAYIKAENVKRFSSIGVVKRILGEHAIVFADWVMKWESRQLASVV